MSQTEQRSVFQPYKSSTISRLRDLSVVAAEPPEDTAEWRTNVRGIVMRREDYFRKEDEVLRWEGVRM